MKTAKTIPAQPFAAGQLVSFPSNVPGVRAVGPVLSIYWRESFVGIPAAWIVNVAGYQNAAPAFRAA